jgi:NADPH-dependent 2,4-dienoyl-CoA reductase/sulfur reductase-like enzyme
MKQKLVVVGNGMAGARAVEEVLARDKGRFDVVMFGAEPYGNYNRILLSNILSGAQDTSEILPRSTGTRRTASSFMPARRSTRSTARRKWCGRTASAKPTTSS